MKTTLLFVSLLYSFITYSQDSTKLKHIDSLVQLINTSNYKLHTDTIKQDRPEMGMSMRTYLTIITNEAELKKYSNEVHITMTENGTEKPVTSNNTFYFDKNKLIKVEEFMIKDGKRIDLLWYYENDTPIYYTPQTEKSQERAEFLLTLAKGMVTKLGFK